MSGRDKLGGDRSEPDEAYPPGERLRPGAVANISRSGAIVFGGFVVLIGALIAF